MNHGVHQEFHVVEGEVWSIEVVEEVLVEIVASQDFRKIILVEHPCQDAQVTVAKGEPQEPVLGAAEPSNIVFVKGSRARNQGTKPETVIIG